MNVARKQKLLLLVVFIVTMATVMALVLYALRQNISLFYTPTDIVEGKAPINVPIRVGGMVVHGSLVRKPDLTVQFSITDYNKTIVIQYKGILPDLFREGQGIVAAGLFMSNHRLRATEVLAKHDEKYMPPEVKQALQPKHG